METKVYWFLTTYAVLLLLQPFLVQGMLALSRQQLVWLVLAIWLSGHAVYLLLHWRGWPLYPLYLMFLFIVWYTLGYLIKVYSIELKQRSFIMSAWSILLLSLGLIAGRSVLMEQFPFLPNFFAIGADSLVASGFSLALFILVVVRPTTISLPQQLLHLSSLVFDVYLIHEQPELRQLIWQVVPESAIRQFLFYPLLIFASCLGLAWLRQYITKQLPWRLFS